MINKSKIEHSIFAYIFFFYPLLLAFGGSGDGDAPAKNITYQFLTNNYFVYLMVLSIFAFDRKINLTYFIWINILTLIFFFLLASGRDGYYDLINTLGFLYAVMFLSTKRRKIFFQNIFNNQYVVKIIFFYACILVLFQIYVLLKIPDSYYFNNAAIGVLTEIVEIYKPTYSIAFAIVFLFFVGNKNAWQNRGKLEKLVFVVFLSSSLPFIFASRSAIGALILTFASAKISLTRNRSRYILMIFLGVLFLVFIFANYYGIEVLELIISYFYDRYSSIKMIIGEISKFPFGVTPSGFANFVSDNNDELIINYGLANSNILLTGEFYSAPESDIAYMIATFGYFSPVIFIFIAYVFYRSIVIYESLSQAERFWIMLSWFIIFCGIGEDSAGQFRYYLFMPQILLFAILSQRNLHKHM